MSKKPAESRDGITKIITAQTMLFTAALLLHIYSVWAVGSSVFCLQPGMIVIAMLVLLLLLINIWKQHQASCLFSDPFFYSGLLFLVLLTIQYFNAGREAYFNSFYQRIMFHDPPAPLLPSSISQPHALEVWSWFFAAYVMILFIRHGLSNISQIRTFLYNLLLNAGILGVFGIIQFLSKTDKLLFIHPLRTHFFASFGYQNFGGEYFMLVFALSLGLFIRALFFEMRSREKKLYHSKRKSHETVIPDQETSSLNNEPHAEDKFQGLQLWLSGGVAVIAFIAVHLSVVITSSILTWGLLALATVVITSLAAQKLAPFKRLNLIVAMIIISGTVFYFVTGTAFDKIQSDFAVLSSSSSLQKQFTTRWWQSETAVRIWRDNKWFGTGGWGYRFMVQSYMPRNAEAITLLKGDGRANVHNDTLQYLAEFGIVGTGLITLSIVFMAWPLFFYRKWQRSLVLFMSLGCLALYLHSMIDLPFRNPPIIQLWCIMLTAAGKYAYWSKKVNLCN